MCALTLLLRPGELLVSWISNPVSCSKHPFHWAVRCSWPVAPLSFSRLPIDLLHYGPVMSAHTETLLIQQWAVWKFIFWFCQTIKRGTGVTIIHIHYHDLWPLWGVELRLTLFANTTTCSPVLLRSTLTHDVKLLQLLRWLHGSINVGK